MSLFSDFIVGAAHAIRGLRLYTTTPRYWKYAAIPTLLVAILYTLLIGGLVTQVLPQLRESILNTLSHPWISWMASSMAGLAQILAVIILLIVLALCLDPLFEACGGPFFAILVRTVDRDLHGRIPSHDVSFLRDCLNTFSCLVYSLVTMLIASGLFCGSLFFPVVLYVVSVLILGFRNAFTFVAEAGFNRNWSLAQLKLKTRPHRAAICGFGAVTFFLAMVPFLSVVFSPACYVGATMLLNEICQDENPLHQQPKHDEITP